MIRFTPNRTTVGELSFHTNPAYRLMTVIAGPTGATGTAAPSPPQGRLTLTSGVPIPTSDVTGATTLYYAPAVGHYTPSTTDGVTFTMTAFTELSLLTTDATTSPAAVAANTAYDVFFWNGIISRGPAWANSGAGTSSRGTGAGTTEIDFTTVFPTNKYAITNGPGANKGILLGSVRSNGSSQLTDSVLSRRVSNIYNVAPRVLKVTDTTATWDYTTATWRQARASTANQFDYLHSLDGGMAEANVAHTAFNSGTGAYLATNIGIDSTSTPSGYGGRNQMATASQSYSAVASYRGFPGLGLHTIAWLEFSFASGTTTWVGNDGSANLTGLIGEVSN